MVRSTSTFMQRLVRDAKQKVFLIVADPRVHLVSFDKCPGEWLAHHRDEIEIFYLPACAPRHIPDEYPMPNSFSPSSMAASAAREQGERSTEKSPDEPRKSRFQRACPGQEGSAGCSTWTTSFRAAIQRARSSA